MNLPSAPDIKPTVIWVRTLMIGVILAAAFAVRLPFIQNHPEGFHKGRQYHNFLIARGLYYQYFQPEQVHAWERAAGVDSLQRQESLEPPVMEHLAAFVYRIIGREDRRAARTVSVILWLIGSLCFLRLAQKTGLGESRYIAWVAYLFYPYGVLLSTSFQVEALLGSFLYVSLWMLVRYRNNATRSNWWRAVLPSMVAVWIKPTCLPLLGIVYLLIEIEKHGLKLKSLGFRLFGWTLILLFPVGIYYVNLILHGDYMVWQFQVSVVPRLLLTAYFWKEWWAVTKIVHGITFMILALTGWMFAAPPIRRFLGGLYLGFFCVGLIFTLQIHTHDYYQFMLIPILCLSFAAGIDRVRELTAGNKGISFALALLLAGGWVHACPKIPKLINHHAFPGFEQLVRTSEEIGNKTNHSTQVLYLPKNWGVGKMMSYHGKFSGWGWPVTEQFYCDRLRRYPVLDTLTLYRQTMSRIHPDYFVVMDWEEYKKQPDLPEILEKDFRVLESRQDFLIFQKLKSA